MREGSHRKKEFKKEMCEERKGIKEDNMGFVLNGKIKIPIA